MFIYLDYFPRHCETRVKIVHKHPTEGIWRIIRAKVILLRIENP